MPTPCQTPTAPNAHVTQRDYVKAHAGLLTDQVMLTGLAEEPAAFAVNSIGDGWTYDETMKYADELGMSTTAVRNALNALYKLVP